METKTIITIFVILIMNISLMLAVYKYYYKFLFKDSEGKLDWQKERIKQIANITNKFSDSKKKTLLDVGCFDRYLGTVLDENVKYVGLDINDKADIQCDIHSGILPLNNKKFDIIVCSEIFEHILNPRTLLKEMNNNIKKEGIGIITMPNENHIFVRLRRLFNIKYDKLTFSNNPQHHIHSPRLQDNFNFVKSEFKIIKYYNVSTNIISNMLSKILPSLFTRSTLFIVKGKIKK